MGGVYSQLGRFPHTCDDDILLVPQKVSKNCVEPVRGIRDENDFVRPGADELGYAMSGRIEVLANM